VTKKGIARDRLRKEDKKETAHIGTLMDQDKCLSLL